jgi:hypothetical protein
MARTSLPCAGPPARTLPWWPNSASAARASSTVPGRWYSNAAGFNRHHLAGAPRSGTRTDIVQQRLVGGMGDEEAGMGVICEQGPPEQITPKPTNERTQAFLKRKIAAGRL